MCRALHVYLSVWRLNVNPPDGASGNISRGKRKCKFAERPPYHSEDCLSLTNHSLFRSTDVSSRLDADKRRLSVYPVRHNLCPRSGDLPHSGAIIPQPNGTIIGPAIAVQRLRLVSACIHRWNLIKTRCGIRTRMKRPTQSVLRRLRHTRPRPLPEPYNVTPEVRPVHSRRERARGEGGGGRKFHPSSAPILSPITFRGAHSVNSDQRQC